MIVLKFKNNHRWFSYRKLNHYKETEHEITIFGFGFRVFKENS